MENELFSPEEMLSPFDNIKETDEEGREWWNSRKLARLMGYIKYWNFERLMDKVAPFLQQEKGLDLKEHMMEIEEMAQLNNGGYRHVKSVLLSRTACLAIALNADKKKTLVKAAQDYFTGGMTSKELATSMEGNVLIYRSTTGKINVSVVYNQETFWLSQKRMAELFGTAVSTINYHLKQIDESGEVQLSTAVRKIRIPSDNCDEQGVLMYNLDAVIAVGYRVNSYEATQFRIWATKVLKEFIIKGFALDDERLKGKNIFGTDYFDELLERIREIRTSERRYYQKITDIYAECSSDYDPKSDITKLFYKTVQNMMHYAVTHQTAAEIIYDRADADKPQMGLMTWKNAPNGRVVKSDVTIAKNYTGVRSAIIIMLAYFVFTMLIIYPFADEMMMAFVDNSSASSTAIVENAAMFMRIANYFYPVLGLLTILRYSIQGMGYSNLSMLSGVMEMILACWT